MLYDKDIREPLFDYLEETYGKVRILEEKRTGSARADVVMITPELNHILAINDLPKYKQKSKRFVQDKILERVEEEVLWPQVCEELFERDYNTIAEEIEKYREEEK